MRHSLLTGQKIIYGLESGRGEYNIAISIRLDEAYKAAMVRRAGSYLLRRHRVLASRIVISNAEPMLEYVDVSCPPISLIRCRESEIRDAIEHYIKAPYDLAVWAGLRIGIFVAETNRFVFCLCVHHLISDWTSLLVLVDEFLTEFGGMPKTEEPSGDLVSLQEDSTLAEKRFIESEEGKLSLKNWTSRMAQAPAQAQLNFLIYHGKRDVRSPGVCTACLDADTVTKLITTAGILRIPLNVLFLVFYAILVSRLEGRDEVLVGNIVDLRSFKQRRSVGYMVNLLGVVIRFEEGATFRSVCSQVQCALAEASSLRRTPFSEVVRALSSENRQNSGYNINTIYNYIDATHLQLVFSRFSTATGIHSEFIDVPQQEGQFDLALTVMNFTDRVELKLRFNAEAFDYTAVSRFAEKFDLIANAVIKDPDVLVHEVDLLSRSERRRFWPVSSAPQPSVQVSEVFEGHAASFPNATAFESDGHVLTFAELNLRANNVSTALRTKCSVGANVLVAICVRHFDQLLVGTLGIVKAGGGYLVIDQAMPVAQIDAILDNASVGALLVAGERPHNLAFGGAVIDIDVIQLHNEHAHIRCEVISPSDVVVCSYSEDNENIYRLMVHEYTALICQLKWMQTEFKIGLGDAILQIAPRRFDGSPWQPLLPNICGARIVFLNSAAEYDSALVDRAIDAHGVTILLLDSTQLQSYLEGMPSPKRYSKLKAVLCHGEVINESARERFRNKFGYLVALHNFTKVPESVVSIDYCSLPKNRGRLLVGKQTPPAARILILDKRGQPMPTGVPGELCIRGLAIARGYLNNPECNCDIFLQNPGEPEERTYRTGNLAHWLPDGTVELLGRLDSQFKIRGMPISLAMIENAVLRQSGVGHAAVVIREVRGFEAIVAYVAGEQALNVIALREQLQGSLPKHLIPNYVVDLSTNSHSLEGKTDLASLPIPLDISSEASGEKVEPTLCLEKTIAEIWAELLELPDIRIDDNFFELGGDSIVANRIISRMRGRGYTASVVDVINYPTIRSLAQIVGPRGTKGMEVKAKSQEAGGSLDELVAGSGRIDDGVQFGPSELVALSDILGVDPIAIQSIHRSSPMQRGMYFHYLENRSGGAHIVQIVLEMDCKVDSNRCRNAFQIIAKRHESLRSRFAVMGGHIFQVFLEGTDEIFSFEDQSTDPIGMRKNKLKSWMKHDRGTGFDLARETPMRLRLLRYAEDKYVLLISGHHIILDGWCVDIVLREFMVLYGGSPEGESRLEPPPSYRHYLRWLSLQDMETAQAFWRKYLENFNGRSDCHLANSPFGPKCSIFIVIVFRYLKS